MRKALSVFTALLLLLSLLPANAAFAAQEPEHEPVAERVISIDSVDEFLSFVEGCRMDSYSMGLRVELKTDIDLSGIHFTPIPIFSGTFHGNGHSISGLTLSAPGSQQGLFRQLTESAKVDNLTVVGTVAPSGSKSSVGGIAGINAGAIRNCHFSGRVSGADYVGGIAGINTMTGIIESCTSAGSIHGSHFVGGVAGENSGVIRLCSNSAPVNTTSEQNDIHISDITMDSITGTESISTSTDIGGIVGINIGVIRTCANTGNIGYPHMGYNIGGIAGVQSGFIFGCSNTGSISGRKDVGGIVGQMEPVTYIEFATDTLQILDGQLEMLGELVGRTAAGVQGSANRLSGQVNTIKAHTQTARDAVDSLLPDRENGLPDVDTVLAAQNALSGSLSGVTGTLKNMTSTTENTVQTLGWNLSAISAQMDTINQTLSGADTNLGISIEDVSDLDTEENITGKTSECINLGNVLADLNAGGIVGTIALENDLDPESDVEFSGSLSLNSSGKLRVVVLNCTSNGTITVKRQAAGGIVGHMNLGLVKACVAAGSIGSDTADSVGGIAGTCSGYIRASHFKGAVTGSNTVGGIAGEGRTVTDCLAMATLHGTGERRGGILGRSDPAETGELSNNYYLMSDHDPGGIDGVSYSGCAQPLPYGELAASDRLPDSFQTVTVYFVCDGKPVASLTMNAGDRLPTGRIPAVPEKAGHEGSWDGIDDLTQTPILFDTVFTATYSSLIATVQSDLLRENGLPVLLAEGAFADGASIEISRVTEVTGAIECWQFSTYSDSGSMTIHFLPPDGVEPDSIDAVRLRYEDGRWLETEFKLNGSYLVFTAPDGADAFSITAGQYTSPSPLILICAGCAVLLVIAALLIRRKRKAAEAADTDDDIQDEI